MHPYKIVITQSLNKRNWKIRTTLCQDLFRNVPPTHVLLLTDEVHFRFSGTVNKQNFRYWSQNNLQELHQRPVHSPKVTVWCAIFEFGVWGPYFFWRRKCYSNGGLETVLWCAWNLSQAEIGWSVCQVRERELVVTTRWRENAHSSLFVWNFARHVSWAYCLIARWHIAERPPRSSDLILFLWSCLKSQVY